MQMFVVVLTRCVNPCLPNFACAHFLLAYFLLQVQLCSDGSSSGIDAFACIQWWFKMGLSGMAGLLQAEEHALGQNSWTRLYVC